METPLSTRRITRSQTQAMSSRGENEESIKGSALNSRQKSGKHQEREKSALIDITNSSPIVGLAMGSLKTPSSTRTGKRMMIPKTETRHTMTPGSGESLLRGQVKTLLQKVEEEGISKICFEHNPLIHKRFFDSPMAVLAPTPANTPQIYGISTTNNNSLDSFTVSPVAENFNFTQMLNEIISSPTQEKNGETEEKNVITRSLLMDFSEKSDGCDSSECNSLMTDKGSDSFAWSMQVNTSTNDEDTDDENIEECNDEDVVEELCKGMSKISVNNGVKFTGKHTRFVYNSDGELEGELESSSSSSKSASGVVCLKGLPTPKGKHLRFVEESEEEEEEEV